METDGMCQLDKLSSRMTDRSGRTDRIGSEKVPSKGIHTMQTASRGLIQQQHSSMKGCSTWGIQGLWAWALGL